jgi:ABC-type multidrug transport system fused ATPase/permease subunit
MSLSEEERHILDEMERSLRRHDRAFVDRVNSANLHSSQKRARWAMIAFMAGFALLLVAFGSSVMFGALGFLVMLGSTLVFVKHHRWRGLDKHHTSAEEPNTPDH